MDRTVERKNPSDLSDPDKSNPDIYREYVDTMPGAFSLVGELPNGTHFAFLASLAESNDGTFFLTDNGARRVCAREPRCGGDYAPLPEELINETIAGVLVENLDRRGTEEDPYVILQSGDNLLWLIDKHNDLDDVRHAVLFCYQYYWGRKRDLVPREKDLLDRAKSIPGLDDRQTRNLTALGELITKYPGAISYDGSVGAIRGDAADPYLVIDRPANKSIITVLTKNGYFFVETPEITDDDLRQMNFEEIITKVSQQAVPNEVTWETPLNISHQGNSWKVGMIFSYINFDKLDGICKNVSRNPKKVAPRPILPADPKIQSEIG